MFRKKKDKAPRDTKSIKYKEWMAGRLDGMSLKCVSERINGVEEIVGRGGAVAVRDGELIVYSSMDIVFRCAVRSMDAWELMSLDGAVITAPDLEHDGDIRTVTVHYTYWRQVGE